MKKLILAMVLSLFVAVNAYSADGDITTGVDEVMPDVTKWSLDSVTFYANTKTCKVKYNKRDVSNNIVGNKTILFRDVTDNPNTPGNDETETEFTQLIVAINNGSNIKNTITAAVKIKLGL